MQENVSRGWACRGAKWDSAKIEVPTFPGLKVGIPVLPGTVRMNPGHI